MNKDLAILSGAGIAWSQRLKRIAERAPSLDIFTEGYVLRDEAGWQLTAAGRAALSRLERPAPPKPMAPKLELVASAKPNGVSDRGKPVLQIVDRSERRRRCGAGERSA